MIIGREIESETKKCVTFIGKRASFNGFCSLLATSVYQIPDN